MMRHTAITTPYQIPYPGTAPFQDSREDRLAFFGRQQEIRDLMALLMSESQVLLFARSGLGKTSLINAGLLERLRDRDFFPVTARVVNDPEGDPAAAILDRVKEEAAKHAVLITGAIEAPSLWAYFNQVQFAKKNPSPSESVSLKPILVLDQFEEVFTLLSKSKRESLIRDLADVVGGHAPRQIRNEALTKLDEIPDDDPTRPRLMALAYGRPISEVRVLISIREDFLAELEGVKNDIPDIFRHTFRLEPLTPAKAREAIVEPARQKELLGENTFGFETGVVEAMIDFLAGQQAGGAMVRGGDVEPVQLQILCRTLFERALKRGRKEVTLADLGGDKGMQRILREYYVRVLQKLPRLRIGWNSRKYHFSLSNLGFINLPRYAAQQLCENGLILANGVRNSLEGGYIAATYGVPEADLGELVQQRLLRNESRARGKFYELSHDSLTNVLLAARGERRIGMAARVAIGLFLIGVVLQPTIIRPMLEAIYDRVVNYRTAPLRAQIADANNSDEKRVQAFVELEDISDGPVNLSGLLLKGLRLDNVVFSKPVSFQSASLIDSSLMRAERGKEKTKQFEPRSTFNFEEAKVINTKFDRSDLAMSTFDDARIIRSSFQSAVLNYASFLGATIADVDFSGAGLPGTSFFDATLERVTFWRADLTNARFVGARLKDVSFSNVKLQNAFFERVSIGEGTEFENTAWWLAGGWDASQVARLEKEFPRADYARSEGYLGGLKDRRQAVDEAQRVQNSTKLSSALNNVAWYRAIHGADLEDADAEADRSMEKNPTYAYALDTKAYILMLRSLTSDRQERLQRAKEFFAKAFELQRSRKDMTSFDIIVRGWWYRYALTLDYLGDLAEADKYYKLSADAGYRPTHELLLMPRPERLDTR